MKVVRKEVHASSVAEWVTGKMNAEQEARVERDMLKLSVLALVPEVLAENLPKGKIWLQLWKS